MAHSIRVVVFPVPAAPRIIRGPPRNAIASDCEGSKVSAGREIGLGISRSPVADTLLIVRIQP
ncbi:unannotated protein [freshwater metagenome]|uniref:Unannotated protein n=1 Tax=freshwater metagenome TaxID=449393 RepID=A0A6J7EWQ2_9ZZZZ